MGRLAGFDYRKSIKKLKNWGLNSIARPGAVMKFGGIQSQEKEQQYLIIPEGTMKAILKQAGVDTNSFLDA